ncbi:MAG: hypothetical protein ACRC33_28580, partial [Gemmataceae bacterium]
MSWRPAPSVAAGLSEATRRWPNRAKTLDGTIGDAAHLARKSDHNPDERGIVHAFDLHHDPANGVDVAKLAAHLIAVKDARVHYLIFNHRICNSRDWNWRPFTEGSPHVGHLHVSIKHTTEAENDVSDWWNLEAQAAVELSTDVAKQTADFVLQGLLMASGGMLPGFIASSAAAPPPPPATPAG